MSKEWLNITHRSKGIETWQLLLERITITVSKSGYDKSPWIAECLELRLARRLDANDADAAKEEALNFVWGHIENTKKEIELVK